jgi:hypothetical protein
MTMPDTDPKPVVDVRWIRDALLLGIGVAAGAAAITIMSRLMRGVSAVGGSCADGGPYVSAQPCPDGTGPAMLAFFGLAIVCVITTLWGASRLKAPTPLVWAWPGLFFALGWNFLDDGLVDPPDGAGVSGGYVTCGVLFFILGALPLLLGLFALRRQATTDTRAAEQARVQVRGQALTAVATVLSRRTAMVASPAAAPRRPQPPFESVADRLQQLSDLHEAGALTDDEYSRAKYATLREEMDR